MRRPARGIFNALAVIQEIGSTATARCLRPGTEGSNWHRYVIAFEGTKTIHGCRQGGLKAVTRAVEEIVAQLNERHLGRFSKPRRVDLVLKKKTRK